MSAQYATHAATSRLSRSASAASCASLPPSRSCGTGSSPRAACSSSSRCAREERDEGGAERGRWEREGSQD